MTEKTTKLKDESPKGPIQLDEKLPESFFAVLGTWEDDRSTEEILRDIRNSGVPHPEDR